MTDNDAEVRIALIVVLDLFFASVRVQVEALTFLFYVID